MTGSRLRAAIEHHELPLASPFGISRGTMTTADVVSVELSCRDGSEDGTTGDDASGERTAVTGPDDSSDDAVAGTLPADGPVGVGAASPSTYYEQDVEGTVAALRDLVDALRAMDDPLPAPRGSDTDERRPGPTLAAVEDDLAEVRPDAAAARAALSVALHDLAAKRLQVPLYRLWGLDPDAVPPTTYTIGLADPDVVGSRAAAAVERGHDHLKVKLGAENDRARLAAVRDAAPDATLRVDANGAWDEAEALDLLPVLEHYDVAMLEQPTPAPNLAALRTVSAYTSIPVAADEACVTATDVGWVADACDVIVCKLEKCGGLAAARRQIAAAHEEDLDVLLGCMVGSNACVAAAWHLAPSVEYVDLDGALLLEEDPYDGLQLVDGAADLRGATTYGTGARRTDR